MQEVLSMKKTLWPFIRAGIPVFLLSVLFSVLLLLVLGGGTERFSTVLAVIGILLLGFGVFSGWGHSAIGKFIPNLAAMDLQHTDPSMSGTFDPGWLLAGVADLMLAFAILWI